MDFFTSFCSIFDGKHYFVSMSSNVNIFFLAITPIGSYNSNYWPGVSSDTAAAMDRGSMKANSFWQSPFHHR